MRAFCAVGLRADDENPGEAVADGVAVDDLDIAESCNWSRVAITLLVTAPAMHVAHSTSLHSCPRVGRVISDDVGDGQATAKT